MLVMTASSDLNRIQKRIQSLQRQLAQLGPMRPGCLSRQYRDPKERKRAYYQLSYTHQMKSRTEYIHPDWVPQIQQEVAEYKRYRELNAEWVQLSIELSRLKLKAWKQTPGPSPKST